jgi:2-C-methyl-D-erythritol 4-phosphate cytidylyltransferase
MNIGILLAAGKSSRFDSKIPKQLYEINEKPIISYSFEAMKDCLDDVVIVTNSLCYKKIKSIYPKTKIVINNKDCRLESLKIGINNIKGDVENIVIHDVARPYINSNNIKELLEKSKTHMYSQYYLKLTNGLVEKNTNGYDVVDRSKYIELCTPKIIDYHLFNFLFNKYIYPENRITCEVLPLMNKFNITHCLIEGSNKYLRKITTIDDIY